MNKEYRRAIGSLVVVILVATVGVIHTLWFWQQPEESDPCEQAEQRIALHEAKYKNSMAMVIKYTDMMNITDELRVGMISVEDFAVEERDIINEMEALDEKKAELDKQLLELE